MSVKVPRTNPFTGMAKQLDINVQHALDKSGDVLIKEAKRRVPVKTGRLKLSLDYLVTRIRNGWRLRYGSGVQAGDEVPYARYQEYGTKRIKPVRFLRGSYEDKEKRVMNLITAAVRRTFK